MIILDFETNSHNPKDVLEVGALKVKMVDNKFEVTDTFHRYYYTKYEINTMALEVHKLTLDVIKEFRNGHKYTEFFEDDNDFIEFCSDTNILVAHNVAFELRYLDDMTTFDHHICTMNSNRPIVKALSKINRIKNPKLIETCEFYNIEFDTKKYHSAIYDVTKTLDIINSMKFDSISDIYEENIRLKKVKKDTRTKIENDKFKFKNEERAQKRIAAIAAKKELKVQEAEEKRIKIKKHKLDRTTFLESIECPECKSHNIQKHGIRKRKTFTTQRYKCMDCNRGFSEKI